MARSAINEAIRDRRAAALAKLPFGEQSARAAEGAREVIADYAATYGLTWGEARRRMQRARNVGRNSTGDE